MCFRINMHSNAHFCAPESIQVHTDLCTRNSKYSIVHQIQYEYRCTESCVLGINESRNIHSVVCQNQYELEPKWCCASESVWVQLYTELCTRINLNRSVNGVVQQNQYEYGCTESCVLESISARAYMLLCTRISINTKVHWFVCQNK